MENWRSYCFLVSLQTLNQNRQWMKSTKTNYDYPCCCFCKKQVHAFFLACNYKSCRIIRASSTSKYPFFFCVPSFSLFLSIFLFHSPHLISSHWYQHWMFGSRTKTLLAKRSNLYKSSKLKCISAQTKRMLLSEHSYQSYLLAYG